MPQFSKIQYQSDQVVPATEAARARLAIVYEHPLWFEPLFRTLEARGINFERILLSDHGFDPAADQVPAPVIFNRVAQSAFLREPEHSIFYTASLLDHWQRGGARVINDAEVLAIDSSKARQLSLIASLGYSIPETRVVHRAGDLVAAAADMACPVLVKANIGGSGAGIVHYASVEELEASVAGGTVPSSIDGVLLVQDYVPARGGKIVRIETLAGKYLYAIEIDSGGDSFDLCPADACIAQPGRSAIRMTAITPPPEIIEAAEAIAAAAGLDVGGVEVMIDDRDGTPRFYDINALSNFVADPLNVLGWDPHERLVDYLEQVMKGAVTA